MKSIIQFNACILKIMKFLPDSEILCADGIEEIMLPSDYLAVSGILGTVSFTKPNKNY